MDLKPHEIALMVAAVAIPLVFLILGFTPGGLSFIGDFLMQSPNMPWVFFGGAALVFCVLAYRIYRRLRPTQKKKSAPTPEHVTPTPKFSLRRDPPSDETKS
jgi:membrane protein implicated in regulation of membrane protease activity